MNRNYNMSDAELCLFTSNLCFTLTKDISELEPFGMNEQKIAELKALGDEFEVYFADVVSLAYIFKETDNKNKLRSSLIETIRSMNLRAEMKWGKKSTNYKRLSASNLNALSDNLLLIKARVVHSFMTEFLTELEEFGLSQALLDDLNNLNLQYENALKSIADARKTREDKTLERIRKGNEIYKLVAMYCEIGKKIFAHTDSARYKNYLLYGTKKRKKSDNHCDTNGEQINSENNKAQEIQ